ncbi:MAG TPA: cupin domain-containing protein [Methanolinea sp.]|nr:cupin domain-containing protein [Methanolinea sp.]HQK55162.1 cupin domain-containing protein [Methanolinea sp.]
MKIVDATKTPISENPHHVDARKLCEIPHAVVVMITLKPGESLKRHMTPVDVIFYVLEGTGTVEIGDEKAIVREDTLIESPAKIPHRWINESTSVFRVLVIKVPRPTEETKLL